jgi:enoyl-ACP reductase-like protein
MARVRGGSPSRLPCTRRSVSCSPPEHEGNWPRLDHQYCWKRSDRTTANVHGLRGGEELVRFTETLAIETARDGIRVNAVAPGAFASGMTAMVRSAAECAGEAEAATAQRLLDREDTSSAQRAARLVVYLTLGEGRDVTGKLISAVWDRWDTLHRHPEVAAHRDVFTLRRIVPEERNLSLGE